MLPPRTDLEIETNSVRAAKEHGRISALAIRGQRDLQSCADTHPDLFAEKPFDPAMLGALAMSTAVIAPWCTASQLRIANRASLWVSAEDWMIDYRATSRGEIAALITHCLSVAAGGLPAAGDPLGKFLAEIRDELATAPSFAMLRTTWSDEIRRMLTADARDWEWKTAFRAADNSTALPTLDEYLDNADNYGASFVNVSHWIYTSAPNSLDHLAELISAGREVQRVIRLINDLASYERDVQWGDINALLLVPDRAELTHRIAEGVGRCEDLLRPLTAVCPQEADYLLRQIGFCQGFYGQTDFWGTL